MLRTYWLVVSVPSFGRAIATTSQLKPQRGRQLMLVERRKKGRVLSIARKFLLEALPKLSYYRLGILETILYVSSASSLH